MFEDFIGRNIPAYAILSHTWGAEEVTFQAMVDPSSRSLKGYKKVEKTCGLTKAIGLSYAWIDTCCTSLFVAHGNGVASWAGK